MEMPALFCVFLLPVFFPISPENLNIWIKSLHTYIHTYTDTHTHIYGTYIRERDRETETERERGERREGREGRDRKFTKNRPWAFCEHWTSWGSPRFPGGVRQRPLFHVAESRNSIKYYTWKLSILIAIDTRD